MAPKSAKKVDKGPGMFVKSYLFLYNFAQVLGWSYLLYLIGKYYTSTSKDDTLWDTVKITVIIFQNAAVLEIFHAALKFVQSNVMITTFQVFSRVMAVCGVLIPFQSSQECFGLPLLLVAWTITEIIRYSYYAINIIGSVPYFIIWSRYTLFIVLYPIGVTGELLALYAAQDVVSRSKQWTVEMPNNLNFTFGYRYFLLFVMFMYIPVFPKMYLHMFSQRKKIIGGGSSKKSQ